MRPRSAFRLGIASLTSDYRNRLAIVGLQDERVLVEDDVDYADYSDFVTLVEAQHGYPATRLQWQPATANSFAWSQKVGVAELLATTGDALRVWEYASDGTAGGGAGGYVGRQPGGGGHRLTLKTALSGVSTQSFVGWAWGAGTGPCNPCVDGSGLFFANRQRGCMPMHGYARASCAIANL